MANHVPSQEQCANCGRHEITADWRYGSKRKRNDFLRRAFGNPLAWMVGVFALADILLMTDMPIELRYPVAVAAFAVIIVAIVRSYRAVYGAGAVARYPDARYTCRVCGHQWTSGGSQTAAADGTDETETTPQGAQGLQPIRATGRSSLDWGNGLVIAVLVVVLGVLGVFVLLGLLLSGGG